MAIHTFKVTQLLNAQRDHVWDFISSPSNLKDITPPDMGFDILSEDLPQRIYPGMMILYKVKPLLGIPLTWLTEITQVKEGFYFVDEQRYGPYSLWHHEHHLEEKGSQTIMTDIVHYQVPMGLLGELVNKLVVKKKLGEIFNHRYNIMNHKYK
jgi:ligand-binding SRPBCC domain-containing protein